MDHEIQRALNGWLDGMLANTERMRRAAIESRDVEIVEQVQRNTGWAQVFGGDVDTMTKDASHEQSTATYNMRLKGRETALKKVEELQFKQAVGAEDESAVRMADELIEAKGLVIEPGAPEHAEMVRGMHNNLITFWITEAERAKGNYENPYDLNKRMQEPPEEDKPLLSELVEPYAQAKYINKKQDSKVKTASGYRSMVRLFIQVVSDMPANKLTMEHVDTYLEKLKQLPPKISKREYAGLSIEEIIALGHKPIAGKTVENHLKRVKSFCACLHGRDYNRKNVAEEHEFIVDDKRKDSEQKAAYTRNDILGMAEGFVSERTKVTRAGNVRRNKTFMDWPSRYWVPLLYLFCGLRLEEGSQLLVTDIVLLSGVWCVDCNWYDDEGQAVKTLKNRNAKRIQPLHQTVLDLGFLEFWEQRKVGGGKRLFPELVPKPSDDNKCGSGVGAWYNGQKGSYEGFENTYIDEATDKSLHSLRHTFSTALGHTDITDRMLSDLMGHEKATIAGRRYTKEQLVTKKVEEINRIDYGVDFVEIIGRWDEWYAKD